jgi:site-specific DNA-methyltransferase (adenine-specific)
LSVNRYDISQLTPLPTQKQNHAGCSIDRQVSLNHHAQWDTPTVIVSDGAYGILGFESDTSDHFGIAVFWQFSQSILY